MITLDGATVGADGALESMSDRVRATCEAWQFGLELKRRAIRLQHPHLTLEQVEVILREWLESDE